MQVMACKTEWVKDCQDPNFEVSCRWRCSSDVESDYLNNAYYFEPQSLGILPDLTIAEAQALFIPIALIFTGAFIWRKLRDVV